MQSILGIDLSIQPCELCLVTAEQGRLQVQASHTVELPLFGDGKQLCATGLSSVLSALKKSTAEQEPPREAGSDEHADLRDQVLETVARLREGLQHLKGEWSSSVVIIPPYDHVSLNINLPFGDSKMLDQVIDLEVQDVVPFELDEFAVQHSQLGYFERSDSINDTPNTQPPYDIHVGIIPRTFVANILGLCKATGIEPNVLTVPSSAVGGVFHLAKDFFAGNAAVVLHRGDHYAVAVQINGQVRIEKTVQASTIVQAGGAAVDSADKRPVYIALRLLIAAAERRYGSKIEKLFFLGPDQLDPALQQILGRPVEALSADEFISAKDRQSGGIAGLSAVFARDEDPATPLSNFRSRQFSFTPTLGEFVKALLGARRQLTNALVSILVCVAGVYLAREYTAAHSRNALIEQIRAVIPDFNPGDGDIRAALIRAETKLSDDLGVLGPIAKVTPVDALLEVMRLIPTDNISISSIKVSGSRATITGTAPKLGSVESVGDALRANKELFSKVTATPGTSVGSRFNFTVEVIFGQ
jgi:hypothetical protein